MKHCAFFSFCDERYVQSALFYKTLEGFIEAGPQFALQFSLLLRGHWSQSSRFVIDPVIPKHFQVEEETTTEIITTILPPSYYDDKSFVDTTTETVATNNLSLTIFDRYYGEGKLAITKNTTNKPTAANKKYEKVVNNEFVQLKVTLLHCFRVLFHSLVKLFTHW